MSVRSRPIRLPLRRRVTDMPTARAVMRVVGVLLAVGALLWLVYVSRNVLTWLAIAAFFAVAINPLVNLFQSRLRIPRAGAILLVYVLGLAVIAGLTLLFVPPLISAATGLTDTVPGYIEQARDSRLIERLDEEYDFTRRLEREVTSTLSGVAGPSTAVALAQRVINGIVALLSIAVICFLLSLHGPRLRAWVMRQVQPGREERVGRVLDRMYRVIAGYVLGVLLVALLGALAVYAFLTVVGVPFAPLLAAWVFLASLVPLVGATLGAIPYIAVSFFESWPLGVAAIAFVLVYQQLENQLVQPVVHRHTVQLNALWIILAVLIGAQVLGIVGVLVAIPIAGIAQVLLQEWWSMRRGRRDGADDDPDMVVVIE